VRKLIGIILGILAIDMGSKAFVHFYFPSLAFSPSIFPYGGVGVFHNFLGIDFCIHHVTNRGAAWGIGASFQNLLLFMRLAVVIGLIIYTFFSPKAARSRYALALVIAGGVGNIADYFIYGHVVDMFHFFFGSYSYPVFNVADTSIFLGVVGIFFSSLRKTGYAAQN
jgi:signal peptidase II